LGNWVVGNVIQIIFISIENKDQSRSLIHYKHLFKIKTLYKVNIAVTSI